jgi:hypothetical protein
VGVGQEEMADLVGDCRGEDDGGVDAALCGDRLQPIVEDVGDASPALAVRGEGGAAREVPASPRLGRGTPEQPNADLVRTFRTGAVQRGGEATALPTDADTGGPQHPLDEPRGRLPLLGRHRGAVPHLEHDLAAALVIGGRASGGKREQQPEQQRASSPQAAHLPASSRAEGRLEASLPQDNRGDERQKRM